MFVRESRSLNLRAAPLNLDSSLMRALTHAGGATMPASMMLLDNPVAGP